MKPNHLNSSNRQEGVLVPHVVRCCVEEVERRGMDEVGIYRISGAANDITELKTAFDSSKETNVPPLIDSKDGYRRLSAGQRLSQSFIKFLLLGAWLLLGCNDEST